MASHGIWVSSESGAPPYQARTVAVPNFAFTKRTKEPATVYDFDAFSPRKSKENSGKSEGKIRRSSMARDHSAGVSGSSSDDAATATPSMSPGLALTPFHLPAM